MFCGQSLLYSNGPRTHAEDPRWGIEASKIPEAYRRCFYMFSYRRDVSCHHPLAGNRIQRKAHQMASGDTVMDKKAADVLNDIICLLNSRYGGVEDEST